VKSFIGYHLLSMAEGDKINGRRSFSSVQTESLKSLPFSLLLVSRKEKAAVYRIC